MARKGKSPLILICHRRLDAVGGLHATSGDCVTPIPCAGRVNTGLITQAVAQGASGVLVIGCGADDCRYGFGCGRGMAAVEASRRLMQMMGLHGDKISFSSEDDLAGTIDAFRSRLSPRARAPR